MNIQSVLVQKLWNTFFDAYTICKQNLMYIFVQA